MNASYNDSDINYHWNQSQPNNSRTEVLNYLFGCEFFVGLMLNSLLIIVCLQRSLRSKPTFIITTFIGFANIIILSMNSLPNFTGSGLSFVNLAWCKLSLFFQIFSYNWGSWLLVSDSH